MMSIKPLSLMSVGIGSCVPPHPEPTKAPSPIRDGAFAFICRHIIAAVPCSSNDQS